VTRRLGPVRRVALVASSDWPAPGVAVDTVVRQWRRELMGPAGAALVVQRGASGVARTAAGLWAKSGAPVEYAADLAAEVAGVDLLIAFCRDLDEPVRVCLDVAAASGVVVSFDWRGGYPHARPIPPGSARVAA
jgi:hypothetical protein